MKEIRKQLGDAIRLARVIAINDAQVEHNATIDAFYESAKDNLHYLLRDLREIHIAQQVLIDKQRYGV